MSKEMLLVVGPLIGVIIGALLNHFLEKTRVDRKIILDKKIEIYSDIQVKLNSMLQDEGSLSPSAIFSSHNARMRLIKSLSRGRLLAGRKLEQKLRDYYDVAVIWWDGSGDESKPAIKSAGDAMNKYTLEIEQLMREEMGQKKLY